MIPPIKRNRVIRWASNFRQSFLILLVLALFSSPALALKSKSPVISRITIRGTDIFDFETNPYLNRFPYSWINILHIQTKDEVLRRELLFKVGDSLDPFLINETERNLRDLSFVRSARIVAYPQRDKTVALVVHVNDAWTTEPQLNLAGINKVDTLKIGFKEKNFLGRGKNVSFFYNRGTDSSQHEYEYTDPQFFNTRWELTAKLINKTQGEERRLSVNHPFFSIDTKWSAGFSTLHNEEKLEEFEKSVRVSEFKQTKLINEAFAALKVGGGRDIINRTGLRYRNESQRFARTPRTPENRGVPLPKDFQTIFLDLETLRNKFIEITRIEKMTRVEDINLGPVFTLSPGFSPRSLTGRQDTTQLEGAFEKKKAIRRKHLMWWRFRYSGRNTFQVGENEKYEIKLKHYYRPSPFQTLVTHTRVEWGEHLDPDTLIRVGSLNGLRAFKRDSIVGTKSWVLNIEDRLFFTDELWNLIALGGVIFYDAGYSWPREKPVSLSKIKSDVGVGLRFGLTRSSREAVLRMDFAYRLQRESGDNTRFVVAFGSEQAF